MSEHEWLCGLDPGIARAVHALNDAGITTFESCEGGVGHAVPEPTIRLHGTPAEGWRALAVCLDLNLPVTNLYRAWDIDEGEPCGPHWVLLFKEKMAGVDAEAERVAAAEHPVPLHPGDRVRGETVGRILEIHGIHGVFVESQWGGQGVWMDPDRMSRLDEGDGQ